MKSAYFQFTSWLRLHCTISPPSTPPMETAPPVSPPEPSSGRYLHSQGLVEARPSCSAVRRVHGLVFSVLRELCCRSTGVLAKTIWPLFKFTLDLDFSEIKYYLIDSSGNVSSLSSFCWSKHNFSHLWGVTDRVSCSNWSRVVPATPGRVMAQSKLGAGCGTK